MREETLRLVLFLVLRLLFGRNIITGFSILVFGIKHTRLGRMRQPYQKLHSWKKHIDGVSRKSQKGRPEAHFNHHTPLWRTMFSSIQRKVQEIVRMQKFWWRLGLGDGEKRKKRYLKLSENWRIRCLCAFMFYQNHLFKSKITFICSTKNIRMFMLLSWTPYWCAQMNFG